MGLLGPSPTLAMLSDHTMEPPLIILADDRRDRQRPSLNVQRMLYRVVATTPNRRRAGGTEVNGRGRHGGGMNMSPHCSQSPGFGSKVGVLGEQCVGLLGAAIGNPLARMHG